MLLGVRNSELAQAFSNHLENILTIVAPAEMVSLGASARLPHTREAAHVRLSTARRRSGSGQKVVGDATVVHPRRLTLDRERKHQTT